MKIMRMELFLLIGAMASVGMAQETNTPYCQILDRTDDLSWQMAAGYVTKEEVGGSGYDFGLVDIKAGANLAYYRTGIGDVNVQAGFDGFAILENGGLSLPQQVGALAADIQCTHRWMNGLAVQAEVWPGFYSDFEDLSGEDVFIPLELAGVYALNVNASVLAGARVYPDFDQTVVPHAGVRYALGDSLLLDLFYPDSRITFSPNETCDLYAGLSFRNYLEYQLAENDERNRLLLDEDRVYVGIDKAVSDQLQVTLQAGQVFNREIEFDAGTQAGGDVGDALFVKIGLGGLF